WPAIEAVLFGLGVVGVGIGESPPPEKRSLVARYKCKAYLNVPHSPRVNRFFIVGKCHLWRAQCEPQHRPPLQGARFTPYEYATAKRSPFCSSIMLIKARGVLPAVRWSTSMCDYSLRLVASRPAKVGDKLISTRFPQTSTRGFASVDDRNVAVCLLPGTELAF